MFRLSYLYTSISLKDSSMKVLNKDSRIVYVNKGQNPRALYEHQIEVQKKLKIGRASCRERV